MAKGKKKAKQLKSYYVNVGGSVGIVQSYSAEVAKATLLKKLHYENKPWLHDGIAVREATEEDIRNYVAVADTGPRRRDGRNVIKETFG